jgi:hypothetical protein
MDSADRIYRDLQRHLDRQAIGFPATKSGAEIRILKRLFSPEEARLALHLTYKPAPLDRICELAGKSGIPRERHLFLQARRGGAHLDEEDDSLAVPVSFEWIGFLETRPLSLRETWQPGFPMPLKSRERRSSIRERPMPYGCINREWTAGEPNPKPTD